MIKTAWKRQNSTGDFPAKISEISELLPWPRMSHRDINIINCSLLSIGVKLVS